MTPELRGTVTEIKKAKTNVLVPTLPEGTTTNDLIILFVEFGSPSAGLPTGVIFESTDSWTLATAGGGENTQAENQRSSFVYWAKHDGGLAPGVNANVAGEFTIDIIVAAIKTGTYNENAPINVQSTSWTTGSSGSTSASIASITPTTKNTLEFAYAVGASITTAITAGWTEQKSSANHVLWSKVNSTTSGLGVFEYKKTSTKITLGERIAVAPPQESLAMML